MITKLLLSILLFGTLTFSNAQEKKYESKPRPADYEYLSAPDSLGVRNKLKMPKLNVSNQKVLSGKIKIPYPIIFIHGLNSDADVWDATTDFMDATFNFTFGGRLDFNLNNDNNNSFSNKSFYPQSGADIAQWGSMVLKNGDYYYLNFAVGSDGSYSPSNLSFTNVLSNQAAIAKQGVALSRAIQQVMDITQRDKVILMGHSMGGLCAREYLQNPSNWTEPNDNHHVAKLITTGTPHGGSNLSAALLGTLITGIDNKSEAVRDLRTSFTYSGAKGVFLSGGTENNSVMNDMLFANFYNLDVNCNGIIEENILGLNQKNLNTDIDFAYIVGNNSNNDGDGVVKSYDANLSNFYNLALPKNEFFYMNDSFPIIHSELPKLTYLNMQGLDEPNEYNLAYGIELGEIYKGFTTVQPVGGYTSDWDYYKFVIQGNGNQILTISNSSTNNLALRIYNSNLQLQGQVYSAPNGISQFSIPLTAGQYFLEIEGQPTINSYLNPYIFTLSNSLSNPDFTFDNSLKIYPNPTTSKVSFDNSISNFEKVSIANSLGQEVFKSSFSTFIINQEVDMSKLPAGVYILKFSNKKETKTIKVIKE